MVANSRTHSDKGFTYVDSSSPIEASEQVYYGLQVWTAMVIASITFAPGYEGDDAIVGATLPAGLYRPMHFTAIEITSGTGAVEKL